MDVRGLVIAIVGLTRKTIILDSGVAGSLAGHWLGVIELPIGEDGGPT